MMISAGDDMTRPSARALPGVPELGTMRIATGATTVEQFVAAFHPYCDAATCFIPTGDGRPVGYEAELVIQLATGAPVLRGVCVVLASWPTEDNRFTRAGVLLHLRRLTHDSKPLFDRLLQAGAAAREAPVETADSTTATVAMPPIEFYEPEDSSTPTVAMLPLDGTAPATAADGVPKLVDERTASDCTVTDEPTLRMRRPAQVELAVHPRRATHELAPMIRRPGAHRPRMVVPALVRPGAFALARMVDPLDLAIGIGAAGIAAILAILVIALTAPH
jgi:hypothetical protein